MRKLLVIMLLFSTLFVSACGNTSNQNILKIPEENVGVGNDFMESASPTSSALSFYKYDGKKVIHYTMFNNPKEQEILDEIQSIDVVEAENWTLDQIKYPVYGLNIGGKDGFTVFGAWCNGYWITQEGKAYQFEFDFNNLEKEYKWDLEEEFNSVSIFPCVRHLCQKADEWNKGMMDSVEKLEATKDVSMEIVGMRDNIISVEIKNDSKMPWEYGEVYSLQTQIDGKWYVVPTIPGNWGFTMPLYILPAGESAEKSYNIEMYGELPEGTYRIVVENLTAEFEMD